MKIDVFKITSDEWYPSFKLNGGEKSLVEVSLTQTGPNPPTLGEWRVCVWGEDDIGMERDFLDELSAIFCFMKVVELEDVTFDSLEQMQFKQA